jgi:hypothetical protein
MRIARRTTRDWTQLGIGQWIKTKRFGEVRRHVVGNYRQIDSDVEILFVVHGARDQERLI